MPSDTKVIKSDSIVLLDGTTILNHDVEFIPSEHHFYSGTRDITNLIRRSDKEKFAGFDVAKDNYRVSAELGHSKKTGTDPLNTNVASILSHQLLTNPLAAPLDALDSGVKKIFNSAGLQTMTLLAVAGAVVYIIFAQRRP